MQRERKFQQKQFKRDYGKARNTKTSNNSNRNKGRKLQAENSKDEPQNISTTISRTTINQTMSTTAAQQTKCNQNRTGNVQN